MRRSVAMSLDRKWFRRPVPGSLRPGDGASCPGWRAVGASGQIWSATLLACVTAWLFGAALAEAGTEAIPRAGYIEGELWAGQGLDVEALLGASPVARVKGRPTGEELPLRDLQNVDRSSDRDRLVGNAMVRLEYNGYSLHPEGEEHILTDAVTGSFLVDVTLSPALLALRDAAGSQGDEDLIDILCGNELLTCILLGSSKEEVARTSFVPTRMGLFPGQRVTDPPILRVNMDLVRDPAEADNPLLVETFVDEYGDGLPSTRERGGPIARYIVGDMNQYFDATHAGDGLAVVGVRRELTNAVADYDMNGNGLFDEIKDRVFQFPLDTDNDGIPDTAPEPANVYVDANRNGVPDDLETGVLQRDRKRPRVKYLSPTKGSRKPRSPRPWLIRIMFDDPKYTKGIDTDSVVITSGRAMVERDGRAKRPQNISRFFTIDQVGATAVANQDLTRFPTGDNTLKVKYTDLETRPNKSRGGKVGFRVPRNEWPVADAGDDQTVSAGDMVILDGTNSDDDDTKLTYQWRLQHVPPGVNPGGIVILAADEDVARVVLNEPGTYAFLLEVTDRRNAIDTDFTKVVVQPPPAPEIEVTPSPLDFGGVPIDSFGDGNLTIANVGTATLTVDEVAVTGDGFTMVAPDPGDLPEALAPGEVLAVTVRLKPTQLGLHEGTVEIISDDEDEGTLEVEMTGTGVGPDIAVSPAELAFGVLQVGETATEVITVRNDGLAHLTVSDISSDSAEFTVTSPTPAQLPAVVAPSQSLFVTVRFAPLGDGPRSGNVSVTSDDPDSPTVVVPASGSGITPDLGVSPTSIAYGDVLIGQSSHQALTLGNVGSLDLVITAIESSNDRFTWSGATLPLTLSPGKESAALTVTFTPLALGLQTGELVITSNDPDSPHGVALSGEGTGVSEIEVSPLSIDFGSVGLGSPSDRTLTISSLGTKNLVVSNIVTSRAEFSVASSPGFPFEVAPGGTQPITVRFVTQAIGTILGTLTVESDDVDEPAVDVALTGRGQAVSEPDIDVSPTTLDFGEVPVGGSSEEQFTIENVGTDTLIVTGIAPDSAYFAILAPTAFPFTLNVGTSQTVRVLFAPIEGAHVGLIAVTSNDPDEGSVNVVVSGEGTLPPEIDVSPLSIDFGNVERGDHLDDEVTITNSGTADLVIYNIVSDSDDFTVQSPTTFPQTVEGVASKGQLVATIRFSPVGPGTRPGTITISSSDPDESLIDVAVTGEGENARPTANAGDDFEVTDGRARLNGGGSFDPDGDPLDYTWAFIGVPTGSAVTTDSLSSASAAMPTFTPDLLGDYVLSLIVDDSALDSFADTVTITYSEFEAGDCRVLESLGLGSTGEAYLSAVVGDTVTTTLVVNSGAGELGAYSAKIQFDADNLTVSPDRLDENGDGDFFDTYDSDGDFIADKHESDVLVASGGFGFPFVVILPNTPIPQDLNGDGDFDDPGESDAGGYTANNEVFVSDFNSPLNPTGEVNALRLKFRVDAAPGTRRALIGGSVGTIGDSQQQPIGDAEPWENDIIPLALDISSAGVNLAPVARAGNDQAVALGDTVSLDGSASYDPDGDDITFEWQFIQVPVGSAVTDASLSDATAADPDFTPDLEGVYMLQLTVADEHDASDTDLVTITVSTVINHPPVADAGANQSVILGNTVNLDGTGSSDPDDDPITYLWTFLTVPASSAITDASLSDTTAVDPSYTPDEAGQYILELTVTDDQLASDTDTVIVTVSPPGGGQPPVANAGGNFLAAIGGPVRLNGSGSYDPDGEGLSYGWAFASVPAGSALTNASILDASTAMPRFTPDVVGGYFLNLTVNDGTQDGAPDTVVVTAQDFAEAGRLRLLPSLGPGLVGPAYLDASIDDVVVITVIVQAGQFGLGAYSMTALFEPDYSYISPDRIDVNDDGDFLDTYDSDGDYIDDAHESDVLPASGAFGLPLLVVLPGQGDTPENGLFISDFSTSANPSGAVHVVRLKLRIDEKPPTGRVFVGGVIGSIGDAGGAPIGDTQDDPIIPIAIDVQ